MSPTEKTNRYHEISQKYGDPWIWGIYIMLLIISIVESYSASSREIAAQGIYMPIIKQCIFLGLGAACVVGLQRVDYNRPAFLYAMIPGLAVITVFSLVYVMFFGEVINGARRAMTIVPGVTLQPAELAKLSIVTILSYIFAKSQKNQDISTNGLVGAALVVALYGGLMIRSGLTNTLLLIAISGSMLLIGGARFKKIGILMVFFGIMFGFFVIIKNNNDKKEEMFKDSQKEMQVEIPAGADPGLAHDGSGEVARTGTWKSRVNEWLNSDSLVYRPITAKNQRRHRPLWRGQVQGVQPPAAGIQRLYLLHHCRGMGLCGRHICDAALPVAAGTSRDDCAAQQACAAVAAGHRNGVVHHLPGLVPHGHQRGRVPCLGTASATHFQGWYIDHRD